MMYERIWKRSLILVVALFLITACAGQQAKPTSQAETKSANGQVANHQEPPLDRHYSNIVVADFTATPQVMKDYPEALNESLKNLVWSLENNKAFKSVGRQKPGMKYPHACLLVQANVSDMRVVSNAARIWGGAFAGSSYMEIDVKLIDAATRTVVRKKHLSSSNNAWAASWVGGSSDRSMPSDMGKIIAAYIDSILKK
jgi:Domain of unknown function (DUF4410)